MGGYLGATPVLAQVDGYNRSQTDALLAQKLALSGGVLTGLLNTGAIGQIKFPAAQNASADANTLDDYEEGTWTPVVGDGTYTYSYGPTGTYRKIGSCVIAYFAFRLNTAAPGAANAQISGLPFSAVNYGGYQEVGFQAVGGGFATAALSYASMFFIPGGTTMYLRNMSTNTDTPIGSNAAWQAGTFIRGTAIYFVAN